MCIPISLPLLSICSCSSQNPAGQCPRFPSRRVFNVPSVDIDKVIFLHVNVNFLPENNSSDFLIVMDILYSSYRTVGRYQASRISPGGNYLTKLEDHTTIVLKFLDVSRSSG